MVGQVDIEVGTLSKAVGSMGGFVCCSAEFKSWLLNKGRAFVYSTALPVPDPSLHFILFLRPFHRHITSMPDTEANAGRRCAAADAIACPKP
jgi:7-keto-8-aminopelargonate synthetase-like enzyme